ncbi:MAG: aldehyde dehydrogenase family protein [Desulfohalobiaceae bacterium]|nr:aldehyde dehydrogenase family protein [Desulfohalobiaceae bacterium]
MDIKDILTTLGIAKNNSGSSTGLHWGRTEDQGENHSISPVDGQHIASVCQASAEEYHQVVSTAREAFQAWRRTPPPQRGEIVRQIGLELRRYKDPLGRLVSWEMGKSLQEGWGEVQEMIDISDLALGQSRQLYGSTMTSERPDHRLFEQYHPLGPVGVITAFNFPVAVWSWNALMSFEVIQRPEYGVVLQPGADHMPARTWSGRG